ncbi:isopentenyl transferase family protein [Clostridium tertium]|nr:AAA family ATPase [Clostridium tertium]MDB1939910.1 isopentenyl transferase family protein [Clostridium tertium]MDB1946347.1 isopentenyl transferase family protein [Clostridium tertium]
MNRIIIIGCGGSGKSTLARNLSKKTNLPVVHLDKIF